MLHCGIMWYRIATQWKEREMLIDTFERKIDSKGRLMLPREFKQEFAGGLIATCGLDNCILLFPMNEWEKVVGKTDQMSSGSEAARTFTRMLFSSASHIVTDAQGRILVPSRLREEAGIKTEVVLIGLSNKVEVWNPEKWAEYRRRSREQYEKSALEAGGY
ncbi:MAG: division/cell wall cluster transcriptional repressor MraZ [Actinomycetota bacterium]|nr:division/cell wall cluster transcriptional repressor MraZ [Actinomycetota bacterium]